MQTFINPIAEMFGCVVLRDTQYDSFATTSGSRMGTFLPAEPTPNEAMLQDMLALRPRFRIVPKGISTTAKDSAFVFKSEFQLAKEAELEEIRKKKAEIAKREKEALEMAKKPKLSLSEILQLKAQKAAEKKLAEQAEVARKKQEDLKKAKGPPTSLDEVGKNYTIIRYGAKHQDNDATPLTKELSQESLKNSSSAKSGEDDSEIMLSPIAEARDETKSNADDDQSLNPEDKDSKRPLDLREVEIVWSCPDSSQLGAVIVTVNVRLEGQNKWIKMSYSLKESPLRFMMTLY